LFVQQDSVAVAIQIIGPKSEMTLPAPTPSDEQVVIHKVNTYDMVVGTDSEPTFSGTGPTGVLTVPINNPNSNSGDFYLSSVTFTSDLASPNDSVTEPTSNGGVFDILLNNPSARGSNESVDYQVLYTVNDPNGLSINGPKSDTYTVTLTDDPTPDNITISPFTYRTYNGVGESSFSFGVVFSDGDDTGVDGVNVYFESDNIVKTLVAKVPRYINGVKTDSQLNLPPVVLQDTATASDLTGGINILDIDGNSSTNKWSNFAGGKILFVPYSTKKTNSSNVGAEVESTTAVEKDINHIPVIPAVENVALIGGVKESYDSTEMVWTYDLDTLYSGYTSVTASYELTLNTQNVTNSINSDNSSYSVDISGALSTYTLNIKVKITAANDGSSYYSDGVALAFDSVSVDQSGVDIVFRRGSNNTVVRATYTNYNVDDSTGESLVVEEVKLVDTSDSESSDPADSVTLTHTGVISNGVQSTYSGTQPAPAIQAPSNGSVTNINIYDISSYDLGEVLELNYRIKAGVQYTVTGTTGTVDSTGLYLIMPAATRYVVAGRPQLTINQNYQIGTGDYAGRIGFGVTMNANGLSREGVQSLVFLIAEEHDHTVASDSTDSDSKQVVLSFSSSEAVPSTYDEQVAATTTDAADNIAAGEILSLTVDDVEGFDEGSASNWTLVVGDLTANDQSVLYAPSNIDFDAGSNLAVVGVIATRLGIRLALRPVVAPPA
jgi:hypothetical protein